MKMTWRRALLLLLCACVLAWCMLQIRAVGSHLQYVFPAPAPAAGEDEGSPTENGWLSAMQESLAETAEDWQGIVSDWTLDALWKPAPSAPAQARRWAACGCSGKAGSGCTRCI